MALKGINLGETHDFVSQRDKDKESPTVFKIGILDSITRAGLIDILETDALGRPKNQYKYSVEVVRFGLKGIENFPFEFKTVKIVRWGQEYEVVDNSILGRIPIKVIDEIAGKILDYNIISGEEEKN